MKREGERISQARAKAAAEIMQNLEEVSPWRAWNPIAGF